MAEIIDRIQISLSDHDTNELYRLADRMQIGKEELLSEIIRRGIRILNFMYHEQDSSGFDFEEFSPSDCNGKLH